ncbi:hypothetical protein E2C01_099122 [Portunus trituberculatus]|uniref:Uncharacterized protein n=1 Tax=Portunus trituberculatus TaxID=210409 RepID=A0A5B7JZH3_PORTR|nr:hypothetical protein [Portunus trituberculatus]
MQRRARGTTQHDTGRVFDSTTSLQLTRNQRTVRDQNQCHMQQWEAKLPDAVTDVGGEKSRCRGGYKDVER